MRKFVIHCVFIAAGIVTVLASSVVRAQPIGEYPRRFQPEEYLREPASMRKDYVTPAEVPSTTVGMEEDERAEEYKMAVPTRIVAVGPVPPG